RSRARTPTPSAPTTRPRAARRRRRRRSARSPISSRGRSSDLGDELIRRRLRHVERPDPERFRDRVLLEEEASQHVGWILLEREREAFGGLAVARAKVMCARARAVERVALQASLLVHEVAR